MHDHGPQHQGARGGLQVGKRRVAAQAHPKVGVVGGQGVLEGLEQVRYCGKRPASWYSAARCAAREPRRQVQRGRDGPGLGQDLEGVVAFELNVRVVLRIAVRKLRTWSSNHAICESITKTSGYRDGSASLHYRMGIFQEQPLVSIRHTLYKFRKVSPTRRTWMKALVVEDDFASRKLLQKILTPYGEVDIAVNGLEAIEAFTKSLENVPTTT